MFQGADDLLAYIADEGVENVDVDVTSGRVILDVAHPLSTHALTQAVSEAGFELTALREPAR